MDEYDVSKFDLTHKMAPFLDVHLVFPLLEFLEKTSYDKEQVQRARLELLSPTNMIDYAIEIHGLLTGESEPPEKMASQLASTLEKIKDLETKTEKTRGILEDAEKREGMKRDETFTASYLLETFEITASMLDEYYDFAKFLYECGDYRNARDMLDHYLVLNGGLTTKARCFQALWGKFASEVLLKNWDEALADLGRLRQAIDDSRSTALEQLQQRSWLLHWSLFVFFNHDKGQDGLIDMFLSEKYLQAIQTNCPWLLRYLTAAVVINKRRRSTLKDLVRVVAQDARENGGVLADPITKFVENLYSNFDFDAAQATLADCDKALKADYFLCNSREAFMEVSFEICFETYCRIHTKIDVHLLATKLNSESNEKAERWIVDLIRQAKLDAKIDSVSNCVVMRNNSPSVYAQVLEKTRDLQIRTAAIVNTLDHKIATFDQRSAKAAAAATAADRD